MGRKRVVGFSANAEEQLRRVEGKADLQDELEVRCAAICAACRPELKPQLQIIELSKPELGVRRVELRCKSVGESVQWCQHRCKVIVTDMTLG